MVKVGSNTFMNVAFPLAFENRYFMLEPSASMDVWTVFTVQDGKPVIEILKNKPHDNNVSKVESNPTGIVTVSDPETGTFLYKLRPGNKNTSIFGRIKGEETEIRITDREIRIGTIIFRNILVMDFAVGVIVDKNGGTVMGASLPPVLQSIFST
jgi:hypothetical protein